MYHAKPYCYVCNRRLFSLSLEIERAEKQEFFMIPCYSMLEIHYKKGYMK